MRLRMVMLSGQRAERRSDIIDQICHFSFIKLCNLVLNNGTPHVHFLKVNVSCRSGQSLLDSERPCLFFISGLQASLELVSLFLAKLVFVLIHKSLAEAVLQSEELLLLIVAE